MRKKQHVSVTVTVTNLLHLGRCGRSVRLDCNCKGKGGSCRPGRIMGPFTDTGNMGAGSSREEAGGTGNKYKEVNIHKYHLEIRFKFKTSFLRQNLIFYLLYRKIALYFPQSSWFNTLKILNPLKSVGTARACVNPLFCLHWQLLYSHVDFQEIIINCSSWGL